MKSDPSNRTTAKEKKPVQRNRRRPSQLKKEPLGNDFKISYTPTSGIEPVQRMVNKVKSTKAATNKESRPVTKTKRTNPATKDKPFKSQTLGHITNVDLRYAIAREDDTSFADEAIPLSKGKRRERQKPLLIDVDRLVNERTASRRVKINTIDVLKYLAQTFEPSLQKDERVNPDVVHHEFRMHLINYLNILQDMHANINDLSDEIREVQQRKKELRTNVYELRKKHGEIGIKLNKLRESYLDSKYNHEQFRKTTEQLRSFKDSIQSENHQFDDLSSTVEQQINSASKLVNPVSGIYSKLKMVNNKLENREH